MTDPQVLSGQLRPIFAEQIRQLSTLNAVLQQESKALAEKNLDQLATLIPQKLSLFGSLQQSSGELESLLVKASGQTQPTAQQNWLVKTWPELKTVCAEWRQCLEAIQAQNLINGQLIQTQLGHFQSALQALLPMDQPSIYGLEGISTQAPRRPIGKA